MEKVFERRLARFDREIAADHVELHGYATVFDVPYEVAGGPDDGGWVEIVRRGAWARTLKSGVNRALLDAHDNRRVLATTRAGTLELEEDDIGLLVRARLDRGVRWIDDLARQIETGHIDEMSVGMIVRVDKWSDNWTRRIISEAQLVEVSVVWAGANPATVVGVADVQRMIAAARDRDRRMAEVRAAAARLASS